jgi:hypothetical protein
MHIPPGPTPCRSDLATGVVELDPSGLVTHSTSLPLYPPGLLFGVPEAQLLGSHISSLLPQVTPSTPLAHLFDPGFGGHLAPVSVTEAIRKRSNLKSMEKGSKRLPGPVNVMMTMHRMVGGMQGWRGWLAERHEVADDTCRQGKNMMGASCMVRLWLELFHIIFTGPGGAGGGCTGCTQAEPWGPRWGVPGHAPCQPGLWAARPVPVPDQGPAGGEREEGGEELVCIADVVHG